MTDHWTRIEERAVGLDRELNLHVIVNDLCRALLDLRRGAEAAHDLAHAALEAAQAGAER